MGRGGHGLANEKRLKVREARLEIVAKLYRKGYSYSKIRTEVMARLNLNSYSKETVHSDVHYLLNEWRSDRIREVDSLVELELARIDDACVELWEQWEASKEKASKKVQKQTGIPTGGMNVGADGSVGGVAILKMETNTSQEDRLGDPRYISEIRQQLAERRKLLGLYAPEKKDISGDLSFASFLVESGQLADAERLLEEDSEV